MPRFFALREVAARSAILVSCAMLFAAGCGADPSATTDDAAVGHDGGGGGGDGASPDLVMSPPDLMPHNPRNPAGLGPAAVEIGGASDLATAGAYVLLTKTGITNVTGSLITGGHLGLSPAAATFITGFSLIADPSNVYATSASVAPPSKVYAATYATPTPTKLTAAILSMQAAYTDAASRTTPDFLNLGSGNIGGKTLAPGLYTWGGNVTIPDDVTISGGAKDVWIFQIKNDLDVSSGKKVILSGGALAKNVFWQVAGQATIHVNGHFEGIILSQTGITLQTTASMNGRALAQSLVALDNNAVTAPQ